MAGNAAAQAELKRAKGDGASPEDVYESIAEQLDELPRPDRAQCLGYLARLVGRPEGRNPYDADDETGAGLRELWARGWEEGGRGDFQALAARARGILARAEKRKAKR